MVFIMKELFVLVWVFGVVKSKFLLPDENIGYNGHDMDISRIFQRLEALEKQVGGLEAENHKIKEENKNIKSILQSKCDCKGELDKNKTSEWALMADETESPTKSTDSTIKRGRKVRNVEQKRQLADGSTKPVVAFRAELSKNLPSVGAHQIIEYDSIPLNIGNAYDSRHGHFTAPVKGLYLLTATVFSNPGRRVVLELVVNGHRVAALDTGSHISYSSNCKTLPVTLEQRDMVWIRTYPGEEGQFVGGYRAAFHNIFAAVLISEL